MKVKTKTKKVKYGCVEDHPEYKNLKLKVKELRTLIKNIGKSIEGDTDGAGYTLSGHEVVYDWVTHDLSQ